MSRARLAAGLALLSALAWCAPPPPAFSDARVWIVPQSGLALASALVVTTDAHGFTRVSVPLSNMTGQSIAAQCVTDWYDPQGHPIGGLMAMPQRIAAAPFSPTSCELVAPNATAGSFRVQVVPAA